MRKRRLVTVIMTVLSALVLIASGILCTFRFAVRPAVVSMAENRAVNIATELINTCVLEDMMDSPDDYRDFALIENDGNGNIISVSADSAKINGVKARLSVSVHDRLSDLDGVTFAIPLSNALNLDLLSGKGPYVNVKLVSVGAINTDFETSFETGAINQTYFRISLKVGVNVTMYVPYSLTDVPVGTTVCIAETVIVGKVPEAYTYVTEGSNGIAGTINDYGANARS